MVSWRLLSPRGALFGSPLASMGTNLVPYPRAFNEANIVSVYASNDTPSENQDRKDVADGFQQSMVVEP